VLQVYDFSAKTYIVPRDRKMLKHDFDEMGKHAVFIVKPPAGAQGKGIKLVTKLEEIPKKAPQHALLIPTDVGRFDTSLPCPLSLSQVKMIVQRYIGKPLLINKKKFDLRIYVVLTSFDPLRIYYYEDGLVRFATHDYVDSRKKKDTRNRMMHLTNYSVNKNDESFREACNEGDEDAHKWTLKAMWAHLEAQGIETGPIQKGIKDIVTKTLIASEPTMVSCCNHSRMPRGGAFEVYGFDILIDSKLKPWLIEVNIMPSLSSSSPLDKQIKHSLMADVFHLVGMAPFDRVRFKQDRENQAVMVANLHLGNKREWKFTSRSVFELEGIALETMTPDELEIIMETEDELRRAGSSLRGMSRIFPCDNAEDCDYYAKFFSCKRYMNTLLWKWIRKPDWNLLLPYCRDGVVPGLPNTPTAVPLGDTDVKLKKKKADLARAEKIREDVHDRLQGGSKRAPLKRAQLPPEVPDGPARGAYLRAKAEAKAKADRERGKLPGEPLAGPQDLLNRSFSSLGGFEGEEGSQRGGAKSGRRATPVAAGGELTEQLREGILANHVMRQAQERDVIDDFDPDAAGSQRGGGHRDSSNGGGEPYEGTVHARSPTIDDREWEGTAPRLIPSGFKEDWNHAATIDPPSPGGSRAPPSSGPR